MSATTDEPSAATADVANRAESSTTRPVIGEQIPGVDDGPVRTRKATPETRGSDRPWRIVGLIAMFAAIGLLGYSLVRGVEAEPGQAQIDTANRQPVRIDVNNFGIEPGMQAGLLNSDDRVVISSTGSFEQVMVPMDSLSIVGLFRSGGTLVGLTRIDPRSQAPAVDGTKITPRTTAQTLVSLFPGVLGRDSLEVDRRITEATILPRFKDLERAIIASSGLVNEDRNLEFALGSTVGELQPRPLVVPECTASGLALGGVCVTQGPNGLDILNQLDRWALLFDAADTVRLCAIVPPAPRTLTLTTTGGCSAVLHLAAPGPFSEDRMLPGGQSIGQLKIAAALTALSSYGVPFTDAVFGTNAESTSAAIERIVSETSLVNTQIRATLSDEDTLQRLALEYGDPGASPRQRAAATVGLTDALLRNSRIARDLVGGPVLGDNDGTEVLELISRAVEWVQPEAPIPFWQTAPTAEIDLTRFIGADS